MSHDENDQWFGTADEMPPGQRVRVEEAKRQKREKSLLERAMEDFELLFPGREGK